MLQTECLGYRDGKRVCSCESPGRLPGGGEPKADNQRTEVVRRDGEFEEEYKERLVQYRLSGLERFALT